VAAPDAPGGPDAPGPGARLQALAQSLLRTLQLRAELAGTELEREKQRALDALVLAALGLLLAGLALVLALGFVVLLLQPGYRLAAVGLLALALGAGAAALLQRARSTLAAGPGGPFALTLQELQRDIEALRAAAGPAAQTPAPPPAAPPGRAPATPSPPPPPRG
jgi:uncharacterized membrane protein YqjE